MSRFEKILLPVDLSEASEKLTPTALDLAEKYDAELHLLFVARVYGYFSGLYVPTASIEAFQGEVVAGAEKKLQEFREKNMPGEKTFAHVLTGDPGEEIVNYAEQEKMDLILIGTHGRKGVDRILFGSVAEHVVKNSRIPVLTLNPYR